MNVSALYNTNSYSNLQRLCRYITDLEDLKEKVANLTNITMTQQVMIDVAITTMEDMYTSKF